MPHSKMLVVDDSEAFRRLICRMLQEKTEFDVIEASDGLDAVEKAERFQPDCVLLDIGLPKLNGIDAGRRIRTACPESDIVFVTQESSPDVADATLDLRARGFIHKSRIQTYLLAAIESILEAAPSGGSGLAHRHDVHFYPDDSVLLESIDRFIGSALMAGNAAIILATKPHREALIQSLEDGGIDVGGAIQQGTYISLDAADMLSTITEGGRPDCDQFAKGLSALIASAAKATKNADSRVAIFGECVALLHAAGDVDAAITVEQTGNRLLRALSTAFVDIMCAYPLLPFSKDPAFRKICAEHSAICLR